MDFALTEDQQLLRKEITGFAKEHLNEGAAARDRLQKFPCELWRKCGEAGLLGFPIPAQYGGRGLDAVSTIFACEALGYGCEDRGLAFSIGAHLFSCTVPIWKHGNDEQRRRYLPGLCRGELIGGNASTEPNAGSDIFAMTTRADREGDGYRVNGKKTFVTNGPIADLLVLCAVTDAEKKSFGGISALLVEKDKPGLLAGPNLEKMGLRSSPLGEVVFENVGLSADALLGQLGAGAAIFAQAMEWERIGIFACHVGTMQRLLERSIAHARTRKQFGQTIGKFQAISHRLADMRTQLEAARLLIYKAAWCLDRGQDVSLQASLVKLFVGESFTDAALNSLRILGGYGYLAEQEVERVVRDSLASTIYSGTSEMQRNIIARWLGL